MAQSKEKWVSGVIIVQRGWHLKGKTMKKRGGIQIKEKVHKPIELEMEMKWGVRKI